MIHQASKREQKVFTYWLEERVFQKRGITATAFLRMCNEGKVPGLEPPNVDASEQREETERSTTE